ncbi:hypothetical protein ABKN59_011294 [Abortiporus biennis]
MSCLKDLVTRMPGALANHRDWTYPLESANAGNRLRIRTYPTSLSSVQCTLYGSYRSWILNYYRVLIRVLVIKENALVISELPPHLNFSTTCFLYLIPNLVYVKGDRNAKDSWQTHMHRIHGF